MEKTPLLKDLYPIPEGAKKLYAFVGDWKIKGTLAFNDKPIAVEGTWKANSISAGWGILNVAHMLLEGMGKYEEVDLIGYDPGDGSIHLFSVTNTAATHDHKGKWINDKTLTAIYDGLQDGKRYREEITITFVNSKKFTVHEVDLLDEKIFSSIDITVSK